MKIKTPQNGEFTMSFTDEGKSHLRGQFFNIENMCYNVFRENKLLMNISEFTIPCFGVSLHKRSICMIGLHITYFQVMCSVTMLVQK